jgi:hypothetical protein
LPRAWCGDLGQRERDDLRAGGEDHQTASVRGAVRLMFIGLVVATDDVAGGLPAVGDGGHRLMARRILTSWLANPEGVLPTTR